MADDAEAGYTEKLATNKKAVAMALQRLYAAGDVEGYKQVLNDSGKVFTPDDMKTYGLDRIVIKKSGGNFLGGAKEQLDKARGNPVLGKIMTAIDAPRVVGTAGFRQLQWGIGNAAEKASGGKLTSGVEGGWNKFREDLGRGSEFDLGDIYNEADANLEAKGAEHIVGDSARGKLQKGSNVAGYVVLDPLSAVGGGSAANKALMKRISAEVGEATAKKIAVHGVDGAVKKGIISAAEKEAIEAVTWRQAEELAQVAAEGGMKKGLLPATVKRQRYNMAMAGDVEGLATNAQRMLANEGRAGLKVGLGQNKKTLIPSYVGGHSVLNPRRYTDDIMKGVGTSAKADEALKVATITGADTEEVIRASQATLDALNKSPELTLLSKASKPGEVVHFPADLNPGGTDIFVRVADDGTFDGYMQISKTPEGLPSVDAIYRPKGASGGVRGPLVKAAEDAGFDMKNAVSDGATEFGARAANAAKGVAPPPSASGILPPATSFNEAQPGFAQPGLYDEAVEATPDWLHKKAGVARKTPLDALRQSRLGQKVGSGLAPRAAVRADVGALGDEALYGAQEVSGAAISQRTHDLWIQLGKTSDKGITALKDGAGSALEAALPSLKGLKGREAFNEMMTAVAEQRLSPETIRAVEEAVHGEAGAITRAADAIAQAAFEGGVHAAPEDLIKAGLDAKPTVAKIISPSGEQALRGDAGLKLREALGLKHDTVLKAGDDLTKEAVKVMRTEKGIKALNDALAERVGLAPGTKFFHEDIVASVALRSRATFEAATMTDMYQGLAKVMVDTNTPLITIAAKGDTVAAKAASDRDWVKFMGKQPTVGDIYGPKSVMEDLAKVQDIVINDEALAGYRKFLDSWNGTWASYAINPFPFGAGFHSRNATGNVLLSFLGGLTNPAKFVEAANVQKDLYKVRRQMTKNGLGFEQAMQAAEISDYSKYVIRNGRKHGIISAGFFADLDNYDLDRLLQAGSPSVGQRAKHFIQDNKLLRFNRKTGDIIENNARIALFMDGLDKTGEVAFAANNVKKYLFDYQDLTPFERRNMKSFNRFYTFMRKNTATQLHALVHDPWRQKMIVQAESPLYRDDPNAPMPDYAEKGGFGVSRFLGTPRGTEGIAMNIETPLDSAFKTLDPIIQAATMVPGFNKVVPPEYRSDKQKLASSILNSRSGGPQELVNFFFETATGKDTFSGKDISEETGAETRSRLLNAFMPLFGKAERGLGGNVTGQAEPGMTGSLELLKALTGINIVPLTDKQRNQLAYVQSQELQSALDKLKDEGVDVPTYTELVRLGLAPDLSKLNKPNEKAPNRTSAQVTEDTITKVNAARAALGMPELTEQDGLDPKRSKPKAKKWG